MPRTSYIAICKASELENVKKKGMHVLGHAPRLRRFRAGQARYHDCHQQHLQSRQEAASGLLQQPLGNRCRPLRKPPRGFHCLHDIRQPRGAHRDWSYPDNMLYVLPSEDIEKLRRASNLILEDCQHITLMEQENETDTETHHGMNALEQFMYRATIDANKFQTAVQDRFYLPGYETHHNLTLKAGQKVLFSLSYQNGRGDLARACPDRLPKSLPEPYKEAWRTHHRYLPQRDAFRARLGQSMDVSPRQGAFPSEEESRNTLLAKKASRLASTECTFDWCNNANHYYTDRAMLAPSLTCRKDITLAAIREMARDGYGESKIQNATNSCTA